jgi:hypothetical protein
VAWQLAEAGYAVELDVWDWAAGRNFVAAMSDALDRAGRVVALFSAAYFDRSRYTADEWTSAVLHLPGTQQGKLVPVRVEDVPAEKVPARNPATARRSASANRACTGRGQRMGSWRSWGTSEGRC